MRATAVAPTMASPAARPDDMSQVMYPWVCRIDQDEQQNTLADSVGNRLTPRSQIARPVSADDRARLLAFPREAATISRRLGDAKTPPGWVPAAFRGRTVQCGG